MRQCASRSLLFAAAFGLVVASAVAQSTGDPSYRKPPLLRPDITAPVLQVVQPAADSITSNRTTEIRLHAVDPIKLLRDTSRLYVPSLSFSVNGVDQSASVTVLAEGLARWFPWLVPPRSATIVYKPTTAAPLPEGRVSFTFAISDRAGNRSQITSQFTTDTTPPTVAAVSPQNGDLITDVSAVVRTLVPFALRVAGPYTDNWDGRDSEGNTVPEGQYRAILLYRFDTETRRFDLGLTTGGAQSNPPRSSIPARFAPLAGRPLVINYTLSRASEVTAFMGRFNVNTRLITFNQREVKGRGTHTIVWNGENSDGQLIHPPAGDSFLFGIFAYTLPNNAIYVRSGVHVSAVSSAPSIFDPTTSVDDGSAALSSVTFTLNRPGSVELSIHDATTGALVLRRTVNGVASGDQSVTWDGRNGEGILVAPGRYRLGVAGIDETGARSTVVYTMQRVYY